jgi:probable HAF family extracellular repeat protein
VKASKLVKYFLTWGMIIGLASSVHAAPHYRYYTMGQGDGSDPRAVNDNNQAIVNVNDHAYLWTLSGGLQDLGDLGGGKSYAYGINNLGQIVGESYINPTTSHAFLWQPGGMQNLGALSGGVRSIATSINNLGQVVGASVFSSGAASAFIWTINSGLQPLNLQGGIPFKIIDDGRMVGEKNNHPMVWTAQGQGTDLPVLTGYSYAQATGINQNGQVVGFAQQDVNTDHPCRAFSWTQNGGLKDLGTLGGQESRAFTINNSGYIVGWADTGDRTRGCLWTPTGDKINLDDSVINKPVDVTIGDAYGINAKGVIVGHGNNSGAAYMLVPPTANIPPLMLLLWE